MTKIAEARSLKSSPPRRTIGFVTACSIVIANIIGTGIFTSLGFQVAEIQSGFALLMLWIIGGIAALCGALCYGELSAALPRSGGEYHFLSQIYHPALGFMAGFVSATVGFAAPIALAAMAFGKYFVGVFGVGSPVAFVVCRCLGGCGFSFRESANRQRVPKSFHTREVASDRHAYHCWILRSGEAADQFFARVRRYDRRSLAASFAIALVYVMYSYSGWNAAAYITGEIKRPEKNVPRSLLVGTGIVIVIYVLLNAIFLATTPIRRTERPTRSGIGRG